MNLNVEEWYPENHIRKVEPLFGEDSPARVGYVEYLRALSTSRYIISPQGDRPDCYRNYEAIGFGCIPISNIGEEFKNIFHDNIIYSNAKDMLDILQNKHIDHTYKVPDINMILTNYWKDRLITKIKMYI